MILSSLTHHISIDMRRASSRAVHQNARLENLLEERWGRKLLLIDRLIQQVQLRAERQRGLLHLHTHTQLHEHTRVRTSMDVSGATPALEQPGRSVAIPPQVLARLTG